MKQEVAMIGGGVVGGALSQGLTVLLPANDSPIMNIVAAAAAGFGATKVSGNDTKAHLIKGGLIGAAVTQSLVALKKVAEKSLNSNLQGDSAATKFMRATVGLPATSTAGLKGAYMMPDGTVYEYDEQGLSGTYMDENGNIFTTEELNGYVGNNVEEVYGMGDGLNGTFEDVYGLGAAEEAVYEEIY